MSGHSEIDNLVKKSVFCGIKDKLYTMRSVYVSGDNAKGDLLFSDLIDLLTEYEKELVAASAVKSN